MNIKKLIANKKSLWDYKFGFKVCGRPAQLGGIGNKALTIKLGSSKDYPNLEIKGFLNWDKEAQFTEKEKELIKVLFNELNSS